MNFFLSAAGGAVSSGWKKKATITVNANESMLLVPVTNQPGMQADYRDLRFVLNTGGSADQKLFLPYRIVSSDVFGATVWVGFPNAKQIGETFTMLWDNPLAVSFSDGRAAYGTAGYLYNDFSRNIAVDENKFLGQDLALDDDPDNIYYSAPSPSKSPLTGTVAYCYTMNPELDHGSQEGKQVWFRKWTGARDSNNMPIFGARTVAFDCIKQTFPAIAAIVTSVTNNAGVARFNHAGAAIYVVGQYVRQAGFSEPTYNGDFLVSASAAGYFELTKMKREGQTAIAYAAGGTSIGTSVSLIILNSTNCNFQWIIENGQEVGVCLHETNLVGSATAGYSTTTLRRTYWSKTYDMGATWNLIGMVGDDDYSTCCAENTVLYVGNDVWYVWFGHGIARPDNTRPVLIYYLTPNSPNIKLLTILSPSGQQLNEPCGFQRKDAAGYWTNDVDLWIRNEAAPFRNYDCRLTIDPINQVLTNAAPTPSDYWWSTDQSAPGCKRIQMGKGQSDRVLWTYGSTYVFGHYSDDQGYTRKNIGYPDGPTQPIVSLSAVQAARTQGKLLDMGNQEVWIWSCRNQILNSPKRSSVYFNVLDASFMGLKTMDTTTLTTARPRHRYDSGDFFMSGSLIEGYRTTSASSVAIPVTHPTVVSFVVPSTEGVNYVGQIGSSIIARGSNTQRVIFTLTNVNTVGGNTTLTGNSTAHNSSGTLSSWIIDLESNLLSNQILTTRWVRNGYTRPFTMDAYVKGIGPALAFFGLKKDEVRAVAVVTVTNFGVTGNVIRVKALNLIPSIGIIGEYTRQAGDTDQAVIDGLANNIRKLDVGYIVSTTSTTLSIMCPAGYGTGANGKALTIETTGAMAANSGNFANGLNPEAASVYQNVIATNGSGAFHCKQNNDTFSGAFAVPSGFFKVTIKWNGAQCQGLIDDVVIFTKTIANGNGVPNYEACGNIAISTTTADPRATGTIKAYEARPYTETPCTIGSTSIGSWSQRADGLGLAA